MVKSIVMYLALICCISGSLFAGKNPIVLITDWGNDDVYAGLVKGAILSVNHDANIVDFTHNIPSYNKFKGAFFADLATEVFPENSIFLIGVAPGAGLQVDAVILQTKNDRFFVGPNNGVMTMVAQDFGIRKLYKISNSHYYLTKTPSPVFPARDIYASVCAHLAKGVNPDKMGQALDFDKLASFELKKSRIVNDQLLGTVLSIDKYGNVLTNIPQILMEQLKKNQKNICYELTCNDKKYQLPLKDFYGQVETGKMLMLPSIFGVIEIAVNQGSAAAKIDAKEFDELFIRICPDKK